MSIDDIVAYMESLPGVVRAQHAQAIDLQIGGSIFASLTEERQIIVKLDPEQQEIVLHSDPKGFDPVEGGWGARGWTVLHMNKLDEAAATSATTLAWSNVAPPRPKTPPSSEGVWRGY
jgi:hypothetical protein